MVVASNATDRLDAIVIGASIEGLFAAASLAAMGKHVAILEARSSLEDLHERDACHVDVDATMSLDLVSHGLRFGAPPPVVGVSQERSLVIWPDLDATSASISAVSARDADAFPAFASRLQRFSVASQGAAQPSLVNWHLAAPSRDASSADFAYFRGASVSRILEEEFSSPLLRGLLAQLCLAGCSVSPSLPGSAMLMLRHSLLALLGRERGCRYVAGGTRAVADALLASLKLYNTADVHTGAVVREVLMERDAVVGVALADGSIARAPHVILASAEEETRGLLRKLPVSDVSGGGAANQGRVRYLVRTPPAVKGVSAALVTSGAAIFLNPGIERLVRAHGALQSRKLIQDYCIQLQVCAKPSTEGNVVWVVIVDVPFVPAETDEGPWNGNRRERFVSAVTKTIEAWAPGFELSIEGAELLQPAEARSFMEDGTTLPGQATPPASSRGLARLQEEDLSKVGKGLWIVGESLSSGAGRAAQAIARALSPSPRGRVVTDA